jgi:hypothetical protein
MDISDGELDIDSDSTSDSGNEDEARPSSPAPAAAGAGAAAAPAGSAGSAGSADAMHQAQTEVEEEEALRLAAMQRIRELYTQLGLQPGASDAKNRCVICFLKAKRDRRPLNKLEEACIAFLTNPDCFAEWRADYIIGDQLVRPLLRATAGQPVMDAIAWLRRIDGALVEMDRSPMQFLTGKRRLLHDELTAEWGIVCKGTSSLAEESFYKHGYRAPADFLLAAVGAATLQAPMLRAYEVIEHALEIWFAPSYEHQKSWENMMTAIVQWAKDWMLIINEEPDEHERMKNLWESDSHVATVGVQCGAAILQRAVSVLIHNDRCKPGETMPTDLEPQAWPMCENTQESWRNALWMVSVDGSPETVFRASSGVMAFDFDKLDFNLWLTVHTTERVDYSADISDAMKLKVCAQMKKAIDPGWDFTGNTDTVHKENEVLPGILRMHRRQSGDEMEWHDEWTKLEDLRTVEGRNIVMFLRLTYSMVPADNSESESILGYVDHQTVTQRRQRTCHTATNACAARNGSEIALNAMHTSDDVVDRLTAQAIVKAAMQSSAELIESDRQRTAECVQKAAERVTFQMIHENVLRKQATDRRKLHLKITPLTDVNQLSRRDWWRTWVTTTPTQQTAGVAGKLISGYTTELVALADQVRLWKARHEARPDRWSGGDAFVAKIKKENMFNLHSSLAQSDPQVPLACSSMRRHLRCFMREDAVH